MDCDEVLQVLIDSIGEVQKKSLRDTPVLSKESKLMEDVPGWDSLVVVEFSFALADALAIALGNREIPDAMLLGSGASQRPNLGEIARVIHEYLHETTSEVAVPKPIPKNRSQKARAVQVTGQNNSPVSSRQNRDAIQSKSALNGSVSHLPIILKSLHQEQ